MKNFALTGVAGYIAPRHLKAIKDTGNILLAALDPRDSVGILDKFFPDSHFFTEFERFERYIEKLRRNKGQDVIDFISICSPNHLHDAHIRFALRENANVICEKPLVLNPWNLDAIEELELESGCTVNSVLQLRLHPDLIKLKQAFSENTISKKVKVDLSYITARGLWYNYSWKGLEEKSGGLVTNIGIHFFDLLIWLFGSVQSISLNYFEPTRAEGFLELERAYVNWFLSIDKNDLPLSRKQNNERTYRSIRIDNQEIEFSEGFTELHTLTYREVLEGNGFRISDVRPSIELAYKLRCMKNRVNPELINKHKNIAQKIAKIKEEAIY